MEIGQKFNNFNEFETHLKLYSKESNQIFVIADCKSVTSANKTRVKILPEYLKYSSVKYTCWQYGDRKQRSSKMPQGIRPNERYGKHEALFYSTTRDY